MILTISKEHGEFVVDDRSRRGSPPVGRGQSIIEAIGSYIHHNQADFDITFEVDESAQPTELGRRRRELAKR